jgi:hypothetical protein
VRTGNLWVGPRLGLAVLVQELMPTTLVDWTRLYRDCGLRRTEEYPRVVPNRIGTDPETKLLRIV